MDNWTEKYRPKSLDAIIGNKNAVEELIEWAEKWEDTPLKKAIILLGPPGVGKTTSAYALAHDFGWEVIELNASDARNKEIIKRVALSGAINETFRHTGEYISSTKGGRKLIILDEADNLYEGGEDYGGKRAIVETIEATQQPIVLIVNDYYKLTKGSGQLLRKLCEHIKFAPVKEELFYLLSSICRKEEIEVAREVVDVIVSRSEGDVRGALNDLQSLCQGRKKVGREAIQFIGYRDREKEIFKGIREILKARDMKAAITIAHEIDESPESFILWIDENFPYEYKSPFDVKEGYKFLSQADTFLGRTYRRQHFGLWRYANDLMCGGVAIAKRRVYTEFTQYSFPSWLRKMGMSKSTRSVREKLSKKIGSYAHVSKNKGKEFIPFLKNLFINNPRVAIELIRKLELNQEELSLLVENEKIAKKLIEQEEKEILQDEDTKKQQSLFDF